MFKQSSRNFCFIMLALLIFCLSIQAATAFAADNTSLPARKWNLANLDKIKGITKEPLTFAILGDSRDNPAIFGQVLKKIDSDSDICFVIHLGDMVRDANLAEYQTFFNAVRQNLHKPILSVVGNHELNGAEGLELFREIFGPDDFAFKIGQHYFIITNNSVNNRMSEEQLRWLEAELKNSQNFKTRMVFSHVPLYDPSYGERPHCLKPALAARLLALFKKYSLTRFFAGHIHSYYAGDWEGVSYTITGGGGAPLYGTNPRNTFYHFLKVTVRDKQVKVQVQPLAETSSQAD